MFLVNSRLGLVCVTASSSGREVLHPTAVVLLPKLRTQFAEFLNQGSLDRLRILYVPTCVGLGYGHLDHSLEVFLGSRGSLASPERLGIVSQDDDLPDLPGKPPYTLAPGQPTPGSSYLPASPHLPQEPLGIRRTGSSPVFRYSCRHSHFPRIHGWVTPPLHPRGNAPLPIHPPGPTRLPSRAG